MFETIRTDPNRSETTGNGGTRWKILGNLGKTDWLGKIERSGARL